MIGYIYLIQEREFIKCKENVYKIGRTKKPNLQRYNQYPIGSELLVHIKCNNCDILERELIFKFKTKYIQRRDIGSEYFDGDCNCIVNDILTMILRNDIFSIPLDETNCEITTNQNNITNNDNNVDKTGENNEDNDDKTCENNANKEDNDDKNEDKNEVKNEVKNDDKNDMTCENINTNSSLNYLQGYYDSEYYCTYIPKDQMYCKKCYKKYKTKRSLYVHESKCTGIDNFSCPKCFERFNHLQSKYRHIKMNTCKPKSINEYCSPYRQYVTVIINNFERERTDFITKEILTKILQSRTVIADYVEYKYFNKKYSENNNIIQNNNKIYIRKNNAWKLTNINTLAIILFDINSKEISTKYNNFYSDSKEKYSFSEESFDYETIKSNKKLYKNIIQQMKDILKSSPENELII